MRAVTEFRSLASIAIATLAIVAPGAHGREFTNQKGQKIEAEIAAVAGGKVTLVRDDKKRFTIPITTLSDADQAFVAKWKKANPTPVNFRYRFDKKRLQRLGRGGIKLEQWAFEMEIHNRGLEDVGALEVKYTLYKRLHDRYAEDKNTVSVAGTGVAKIKPIRRGNSGSALTKGVTISKHNSIVSNQSGNTVTTTYRKWHESLSGIRVEVFQDGRLVDSSEFGTVSPDKQPRAPGASKQNMVRPQK